MDWEGPEALEPRKVVQTAAPTPIKKNTSPEPTKRESDTPETSDDGSADEYIAEDAKLKFKVRLVRHSTTLSLLTSRGHLQSRGRHPTQSETGSDSDDDAKHKPATRQLRRPSAITVTTRTRTLSGSPGPSTPLKRRQSTASSQPEPKRKRSESAAAGAGPDAARKYCLTKLCELFRSIFLRHPMLGETADDESMAVEKKSEDLSEEEKEQLEARANQFATELEECMFEMNAESDVKTGKPGVGAKYK